MLTETDIERLGYGHEAIFVDLQQQILSDIVRRIKATDVITRTADFQINQLKQLGMSDREIYEKLHAALGRSDQYIDQVFKEAIETDYIDNKELYKAKGKEFIPFKENAYIQDWIRAVSKQTKEEMHNLARQIGFVVRDKDGWITRPVPEYVRNLLDNAILQVQMGTFDYNTVLKKAVQEMTNSGIRFIEYGSGRMNRVTVAARRAVMTGTSQIVKQINEKTAEDLQTEHFEVTAHANARPSHAIWQGRVYTRKELETVCGLGTVTGLLGANCYHLYYPFIPGVSKRTYTDKELERMNTVEPKEYQGESYTGYEAQQKMRRMETNMRAQREKIKLLKEGGADQTDVLGAQAIYRRQMDDYVKFAKAMGMKQQKERIYVDGLGKVGTSKKIVFGGARITNPNTKEAQEHAKKYYGLVNSMKTDVSKISKNTGYRSKDINKVKDYVFKKHSGVSEDHFFYDAAIAQSWQRLIDGKDIKKHDLILLDHEFYELTIKKMYPNISHEKAHHMTEKMYNYSKESRAYYGSLEKLKKSK